MTLDRSVPASVDLLARIRASLSSLSPAELRIAEIIEADPSLASTLTVNDLAERASTSTATVVRTAKRLGFEGYPQLRLALAAISGSSAGDTIPLGVDIVAADSAGEVMAKLAEFESEQLKGTAQLTDPAALEEVVSRIRSARRVEVYGIGASGIVAQDLTLKLSRIDVNCRVHLDRDAAMAFVDYMLGPSAQKYFSEQTYEYPVVTGQGADARLKPLAELRPPALDLSKLDDLQTTLNLLRSTSVLK